MTKTKRKTKPPVTIEQAMRPANVDVSAITYSIKEIHEAFKALTKPLKEGDADTIGTFLQIADRVRDTSDKGHFTFENFMRESKAVEDRLDWQTLRSLFDRYILALSKANVLELVPSLDSQIYRFLSV